MDGMQTLRMVGAMVVWCFYTTMLAHMLDRSRAEDHTATLMGLVVILLAGTNP